MVTVLREDAAKSFAKSIKAAMKKQKSSNSFKEIKEIKQKLTSSGIESWLLTLPEKIDFSKISYFIPDKNEEILFDFLCLDLKCKEIDFKSITVKQAVDCDHPILGDLVDGFYSNDFDLVREKLISFDSDLLEGYEYFKDMNDFNKNNVVKKISELAETAKKSTKVGKAALSKVSHASKFSHPDTYYPRIYIRGTLRNDGFVRTGNMDAHYDMHTNAAQLPIYKLKFHLNCALVDHPTMRSRASTKDFRGSFCFLLQTALKSSLNAALAMICLKSEKAKLLRPLTLCRRSGMFSSRVA